MLPLSISARGSSSCRLLGKLWLSCGRCRASDTKRAPGLHRLLTPRDKSAPTTLSMHI